MHDPTAAGCPILPVACIRGGATIGEDGAIQSFDCGEKRGTPRIGNIVDQDVVAFRRCRVDANPSGAQIIGQG